MRITGTVALGLALAAGSALAQEVKTDYDKSADFSAVKTFSVKIGTGWGNPITEKRVSNEIQQALVEKGWKVAPEASADAIVVLHGATQQKKNLNTFYSGGGGAWGGWGYRGLGGGGMGMSTTTVSDYTVGTLVVDIYNKSHQLLFRGTATGEISDNPEKNKKKMGKVTDKMFKDFPPGSEKKK